MANAQTELGILERLIPAGQQIPTSVAQFFLELSLSKDDHQRIRFLSEKANEGDLSDPEKEELSTYVILADFLTVMQAKARISLKQQNPAA